MIIKTKLPQIIFGLILVAGSLAAGCQLGTNPQNKYIRQMYTWYQEWQSAGSAGEMADLMANLEAIGPPSEPIPVKMDDKLMYNIDSSSFSDYKAVNEQYLEAWQRVSSLEQSLASQNIEDTENYAPLVEAKKELETVNEKKVPIEARWLFMFMTYLPEKFA
jgi:hypothetical protein